MTEAEQKLLEAVRTAKQSMSADGNFGRIGDGTILKVLLENIPWQMLIQAVIAALLADEDPQTT